MIWIFAYGSLIFRPSFEYLERRPAETISGWARRFWQGSPDHRGVPEAPGRVVTLVPMQGATCAGVAYRIAKEGSEDVLAALDHREIAGFVKKTLPVFDPMSRPTAEVTSRPTTEVTGRATAEVTGRATAEVTSRPTAKVTSRPTAEVTGEPFAEAITYVADETNPHFLGPLDERGIAEHVKRSHGPSGSNVEYVLRLRAALAELGHVDEHVEAIARWLE